jgi:biotin transport system permease protein
MSLGLYFHADSPLHSLRPGIMVAALVVFGTIAFMVSDWRLLLACFGAVMLLYALARIPWRTAFGQIRPALWLLLAIFVIQAAIDSWTAGSIVVLRFATLILMATLVTLTTRSSAMIEAFEAGFRPLRHIGLSPNKISLALSLALRFIPVISAITQEVREAQRARGLHRNMLALAVPVVVRTLKMADDIADAIEARSYDSQIDSTEHGSRG